MSSLISLVYILKALVVPDHYCLNICADVIKFCVQIKLPVHFNSKSRGKKQFESTDRHQEIYPDIGKSIVYIYILFIESSKTISAVLYDQSQ